MVVVNNGSLEIGMYLTVKVMFGAARVAEYC